MTLRVRNLFIYPLKSAAPLRVAEATVDALGLAGDRRWMAVDEDGNFLSQRRNTRLALIQATNLPDDGLFLSTGGRPSLRVAAPRDAGRERHVVIWDDTVCALDAGDEAGAWMSHVLRSRARLVYCPPSRARVVDTKYASGVERVGFADGFPILVLGSSTVEEVNQRLHTQGKEPIGVERFRPNIVIEGGEPFAEDQWEHLDIDTAQGSIRIDLVKPCARCSIISVDPRTAVQGIEPMRTLSTYRRRGDKVYVAQNGLPRSEGQVATGSRVTVALRVAPRQV
jgi:uncharacterized protein